MYQKSPDFETKKKNFEVKHISKRGSRRLPKYSRILKEVQLSSLPCSQIWLLLLVDNCQCATSQN
jgi:hypothetical protein